MQIVLYTLLIFFLHSTNSNKSNIMMNIEQPKAKIKKLQPNIIVFMADDLGWNDVSFHGSDQIPTPNIDAIAYNGIILNDHYVGPSCASSRASFLTGHYFIHLGLQHSNLSDGEPTGLRLDHKLLPEYLREVGYNTYAVGKWNLGFALKEYTPTFRGFDSHYGFWTSHQDYFSHVNNNSLYNWSGYDMRSNMSIDWTANGTYTTDLFTKEAVRLIRGHNKSNPLFLYLSYLAPNTGNRDPQFITKFNQSEFSYIKDPQRRAYAVKVSKLDKSVGEVMHALQEKKILNNSVVLFLSDNGGLTVGSDANMGSNYPLRGVKGGPWEGSARSVAALWSPFLNQTQWISHEIISIVDWFTTFTHIAGVNMKNITHPDGVNLWPFLSGKGKNIRTNVLINMDDVLNHTSIRYNDYKFINGTVDEYSDWYGETGRRSDKAEEGGIPIYSADQVLQSKTGLAIADVIKARQMEFQKANETRSKSSSNNVHVLTMTDILNIRKQAEIWCNKTLKKQACNPAVEPCLFNIYSDPCELNNIAKEQMIVIKAIELVLEDYKIKMFPTQNIQIDYDANPSFWNNTWDCWLTNMEYTRETTKNAIIGASVVGIGGVILLIIYGFSRKFGQYNINLRAANTAVPNQ